MKTSELTGAALNWAVGKAEGLGGIFAPVDYCGKWEHGGPIIEREAISIAADTAGMFDTFVWFASVDDILVDAEDAIGVRGPTPLIAAMRCYVASKLGDDVDVPEGL